MSLLKFWLLRFLLAGTFFFADGANSLATVEGGGDGGAGDSTGDAGDAGAGDSSGDSTGGDEGDGVSGGDSDKEISGDDRDADPNAEVSLDGRKIPAKYKELFEKDKDLRSIYFANQALKRTFPGGVKEAIQLARQVEEWGGPEGIEKLQNDLSVYTTDAEAFNAGDPKWTESAFQENPDLALKHFANALGYVAENHPEHYDHWMAKVIVNDLANLPVEKIYGILKGLKDNPEAAQAAAALAKYYNSRNEFAKKAPEKKTDKALDAREQQLTQKEQEVRNKTINTEAGPYLARSIDSSLGAWAKSSGFDLAKVAKEQPNRYGRFLKDVRNAVHQEILHDDKWLDRYSEALASGDTQKCVRMLNKRHDQALHGTEDRPGVATVIARDWFGTGKPGKKAAASGGGASSAAARGSAAGDKNVTLVNALPPAKDIDYSWSGTDKWAGKYRLKTGKLIQVKRA